ncbi:nucleotide pyrophosphatase/phosphodiesterase-like [Chenopodium quinoa]|uniref:nucleotide pyrophosphatase/phosphodiesterase-like n=1 Tax=Chenopodium quinoa TaxID=63459 RepID=UPI000B777AC2|nr:nucleotide pyrophosphatase/phosphodiesterase-like [Chenopodium quinoa]
MKIGTIVLKMENDNYKIIQVFLLTILLLKSPNYSYGHKHGDGVQPLSQINILGTTLDLHKQVHVDVSHALLDSKENEAEIKLPAVQEKEKIKLNVLNYEGDEETYGHLARATVNINTDHPSSDDWVAVFSPSNFNASTSCQEVGSKRAEEPYICTAPIKYKYVNYSSPNYLKTGKATMDFELINQRADFAFAVFSGGLSNPKLVKITKPISPFPNPKAPLYPRLAMGETWDVMTVTWTSGYNIDEAVPFVEWGRPGGATMQSPAGTFTYIRSQMCGSPARTVGWRDPGFIHTSFLKDLWPNTVYTYRMGHLILSDGSYVWSKKYQFKSPPVPGESFLQRVVIFGDMGKGERDGSNEYANYQPGALNTTDQLIKDIDNIDAVFLIGDLPYANGYVSQWDQFTAQVEPIASAVPFMVASGNHERDSPDSGSFYANDDSGGECGVPAETTFYVPAKNRAKFWYSADYGMFHFCIADTEHDWRAGTEQYKFLEECLASANRHKQPWLIFAGHRPLGYSSNKWFGQEGSFEEPMGRDDLQRLWQKYRVDIAFWGHVHNYERTCPIYQNQCVKSTDETSHYSGVVNGTIHVVAGGGGAHLNEFSPIKTIWSIYRDYDFGFVKLTAYNYSHLKFEYKKSSDGKVYDSFTISRDYKDVLSCVHDSCAPYTLAS